MRIARINGSNGPEYVIEGADGTWVGIGSLDISASTTPELVDAAGALRAVDVSKLEGGVADPEFMAPIVAPGKLMAIGMNYADHIRETGVSMPPNPILFMKANTSLTGPYSDIVVDPEMTEMADYETELTVVIGKRVKRVSESEALDAVFGYTIGNDVTARDCMKTDGQLVRSKSFDTYCPTGPWITTADEIADPQALGIKTLVNGETRQDSSTREMVFSVAYLIHFLSKGMTLEAGDVILTGTPHGVGFVMDPPRFLLPGDIVESEVEGLGRMRNPVVAPAG